MMYYHTRGSVVELNISNIVPHITFDVSNEWSEEEGEGERSVNTSAQNRPCMEGRMVVSDSAVNASETPRPPKSLSKDNSSTDFTINVNIQINVHDAKKLA